MRTPFYRALLVSGCVLSLATFSACADDAADDADADVITEEEVIMEPAEELDSLGGVIEDAAAEAAEAAGDAADAAQDAAADAAEAAGAAADAAGDAVGDAEDDGAGE